MTMKVALLDDYQRVALSMADWDRLRPACEVVAFSDHLHDEDGVVQRLAGFDIVMVMRERTPLPARVLQRLPKLKLVVTGGMRNASIDMQAARERGIVVSGTGGLPYPTAELAIGLMLAWARSIPQEERALREGSFQTTLGRGVNGKTLGLLGLGTLGSRVAKVALALEMNVVAWSQNLTDERAAAVGAKRVEKDDLLRQADYVSLHLVLSDRTRNIVGARELALMKPTACLINTSRAGLVDQQALLAALTGKRIAGAALDVYEIEPLPRDHPLRRAPNTVLTPHLGYVTAETYEIFFREALEDIEAFLAGTPLRVLNAA
jgi:phosphoglycerate dehydrogenase-like enzyme